MSVSGTAAASWLRAQTRLAHLGACLHYVWLAYKAQGASTGRSAQTALQAWNLTLGRHSGDRNPPAGVPVWFGAKPSSAAGDVVISLGNGNVVCTDYPAYGRVGVCTIAQREQQIGRPYLGWSEYIFDQRIAFPALSGSGTTPAPAKPAPSAPPPIPEPSLEELMSLKSAVIAATSTANKSLYDGCLLDFEDGFRSDWGQVETSYNTTLGKIFTDGGAVIVTRAHYDKLIRDFDAFQKARREHDLAVARASAGK